MTSVLFFKSTDDLIWLLTSLQWLGIGSLWAFLKVLSNANELTLLLPTSIKLEIICLTNSENHNFLSGYVKQTFSSLYLFPPSMIKMWTYFNFWPLNCCSKEEVMPDTFWCLLMPSCRPCYLSFGYKLEFLDLSLIDWGKKEFTLCNVQSWRVKNRYLLYIFSTCFLSLTKIWFLCKNSFRQKLSIKIAAYCVA